MTEEYCARCARVTRGLVCEHCGEQFRHRLSTLERADNGETAERTLQHRGVVTVIWDKYGFVHPDDDRGEVIFDHAAVGGPLPPPGTRVRFAAVWTPRGRRATHVELA